MFGVIGMGTSYMIGNSKDDNIKLDVYYTDSFIQEAECMDSIRMATAEEIIAMKFEVISQGGRKKDFWDIHELTNHYTIDQMLDLHQQRYPYGNSKDEVLNRLLDFSKAEDDLDPVCLKNKHWKLIKIDITDFVRARK